MSMVLIDDEFIYLCKIFFSYKNAQDVQLCCIVMSLSIYALEEL